MQPAILSGGIGSRLWPLSRTSFPKQFSELLDESLMRKTLKRLSHYGSPWVITVDGLSSLTRMALNELHLPSDGLILEPYGKNTAAAIALLCRIMQLRGRADEVAAVFPADHLISNEAAFQACLNIAIASAERGLVATLGIRPDSPATGFGYMDLDRKGQPANAGEAFVVRSFREKPDRATAEAFLAQGSFVWNSGIFVFKVSTLIGYFEKILPEVWAPLAQYDGDEKKLASIYHSLPSISLDHGLLEKLKEGLVCVPCDMGWSDLGSWDDVARLGDAGVVGVANVADVVTHDSKNCSVISSEPKVVALSGVQDLIVVETADALLIAKKGTTQHVREIVEALKSRGSVTVDRGFTEIRPWGRFMVLRDEKHFKSKLITLAPGAQISYQYHNQRAEHWVVVSGCGEVTLNEKIHTVSAGESIQIPLKAKHRIRNPGAEPLEFIEVQTGTYFGEDDIVRLKDDYQRI